ncbi:MAG: hypothetical protein MUE49_05590 [Rhodospirillales bacterium]|jgi:hypothetical protein|nr:hypothetical protein [Rhodospirillales bacterium]
MVDDDEILRRSWARFRDLPDDILKDLPLHVRIAFAGARRYDFAIELLAAGVTVPAHIRSPRRLVLISDDGGMGEPAGPVAFDLRAIEQDVRAARRIFIISQATEIAIFEAAYTAAVADLAEGADVALVVETEPELESAWVRTLTSLRSAVAAAGCSAA